MGSPGKLNDDILYEIAQFLKPSPVLYTRLAMVNKDFYRVFTSDRLWSALDIYDHRSGIFEHFRESIRGYEGLLALIDCNFNHPGFPLPQTCRQRYIRLWYHVCDGFSSSDDFNARETKALVTFNPYAFRFLPQKDRNNTELALYACRKDVTNFAQVSERLAHDGDFVKTCLKDYATKNSKPSALSVQRVYGRVGPQLGAWLWEAAPAFYVHVWFAQQSAGLRLAHRHPSELITDREMAVTALKGNAKYVGYFPEYHNDLEVVLAFLTPPIMCEAMYNLLRNHKNDALVAAVLDQHPYLLYAAPGHLRGSKEIFYRFLDSLEYMVTLRHGTNPCRSQSLLNWVPDSIWADPAATGRIVDVIGEDYPTLLPETSFLYTAKVFFGDFEWAKKRVEYCPLMWRHASKKLQHSDLLRHAVNTMRLFSEAPYNLRMKNCDLGSLSRDIPLDRADYSVLRELALTGCELEEWANLYKTRKMIKAAVSVNLLGEHRGLWLSAIPGPQPEPRHIVETVRSELLTEYVQDPINLANLMTLRFTLHWLWDTAETVEFAETYLGARPPEIGLEEFAKLDEDVYYPMPTHSRVPAYLAEQYSMEVQDAARLVRWNAHLYWNLSKELREDEEVRTAIGRLRKHRCGPDECNIWHRYRPRPWIVLEAAKS